MNFALQPRFLCLSSQDNYEILAQPQSRNDVQVDISQILENVNDNAQQGPEFKVEQQNCPQSLKCALLQSDSSQTNIEYEPTQGPETEMSLSSSNSVTCGQEGFITLLQCHSGGRRKTRAFKKLCPLKSIDQLLIKHRSTRNKLYRNDELAKKIIRGIATNYHKWFLANITRTVKRSGKASQQRRVLLYLLSHLGINQIQVLDWIHSDLERKILDTTFLTVGAKTSKNSLKRENIFNGTKKACIQLFKSDIGKALYLSSFVRMWNEFVEKQTESESVSSLTKYLHSILESVGQELTFQ